MRLIERFRSLRLAFKASGLLGRANKLRGQKRTSDALELARSGLSLLATPGVFRQGPHEGSVLLTLTFLAEQLAAELGQPGASDRDLRDSLALLESLPDTNAIVRDAKLHWLPCLQERVGHEPLA